MSTESIFINELKYDLKKENFKKFIFKNINNIIFIILFIFLMSVIYMFSRLYISDKIKKYNEKIYKALDSQEIQENLEKIYKDKSIPSISKTFAGLCLINIYKQNNNYKDIIKIYNDILNNENNLFFKNYAGLNLLIIKLNDSNKDIKEIKSLIKKLENKKNPLINLVLEQKALFLIDQNKKEEAQKILNDLAIKNIDKELLNRVNQQLLILK